MPRIGLESPGQLATVQSVGNVAASVVAGLLYTFASPTIAFGYLAVWMLIALGGARLGRSPSLDDAAPGELTRLTLT